jgi:GNAT superfamily N-acetyltransferase
VTGLLIHLKSFSEAEQIGVLEYRRLRGGVYDLYHTEVLEKYRGQGIAKHLAKVFFSSFFVCMFFDFFVLFFTFAFVLHPFVHIYNMPLPL